MNRVYHNQSPLNEFSNSLHQTHAYSDHLENRIHELEQQIKQLTEKQ
ncbi:hypothetical protein [Salsuginibacillus kocurii]|nr:hypothetical protein [Salsuginibacillus kocurii]